MNSTEVSELVKSDSNLSLIKNEVEFLHPKKIFLFGSRARGDERFQSDYDIMIVLGANLSVREKAVVSCDLRKKFAEKNIDIDPIIKTTDDVEYFRDKPGSIVRTVLHEGVEI